MVADITKGGGKAVAVQGDVSNSADVKKLFGEATEASGRVDVLVNNAGVYKFRPLDQAEPQEFHRQFDTNVLGTVLATSEAARISATRAAA